MAISQFILYVGAAALGAAFLLWLNRRPAYAGAALRAVLRQGCALIAVTTLLLLTSQLWPGGGFLDNAKAIANVQDVQISRLLSRVDASQVEQLRASGHVMLVDARHRPDFVSGHLPGAINLPPSLTASECEQRLTGVPRTQRLLVYCQSRTCPFSEVIARKLLSIGYHNIVLFPDGWAGWEARMQGRAR